MEGSHYVCTKGCNGAAVDAGTCDALDCPGFGEVMAPCGCAGGVVAHRSPDSLPRNDGPDEK